MAPEAQTAQRRLTNETDDMKLKLPVAQLTGREDGLGKERKELQARDVKELMPQIYRVPQQYQ